MRVVLTPEVVAASLRDSDARAVLAAWRDGSIRAVVSRELVRRTLRVLHRAGVPAPLLRRWLWWFTAPSRVETLPDEGDAAVSTPCLCERLAREAGAGAILVSSACVADRFGAPWRSARAFLDRREGADRR